MKPCMKCGETFSRYVYIDGGKRNLHGRKYCLECLPFKSGRLKSENALAERRAKQYTYKRNRVEDHQEKALTLKGGCCCICGYSKASWALDFHHVNPKLKTMAIARNWGAAWERLEKELEKCILVCRNCHREIEAGITEVPEECLKGIVY